MPRRKSSNASSPLDAIVTLYPHRFNRLDVTVRHILSSSTTSTCTSDVVTGPPPSPPRSACVVVVVVASSPDVALIVAVSATPRARDVITDRIIERVVPMDAFDDAHLARVRLSSSLARARAPGTESRDVDARRAADSTRRPSERATE